MQPDELPAVVYVDDESMNLRVFEANFRKRFRVCTFVSAPEALAALPQLGEVAVLLSDQRMPEMSGVELLERSRELVPDAARMLVTAYSDVQAVIDAVNRGQVSRYFVKPWSREDLLSALEDAVRIYRLQLEIRQMEARLLKTERLASLGQVSAGIAHELLNPVGYMVQNVELLRRHLSPVIDCARRWLAEHPDPGVADSLAELPQLLADIETGGVHLRKVASGVRRQARGEEEERAADVADVAAFALKLCRAEVRQRAKVAVEGPSTVARIGPVSLCQVLLNLIVNAAHAMEGRERPGLIEVRWRRVGERVEIEVADNGSGIAPELREKVFEPLFTTKPAELGTGLGLAICRDIVRKSGGELTLDSVVGQGTTLKITLPAA